MSSPSRRAAGPGRRRPAAFPWHVVLRGTTGLQPCGSVWPRHKLSLVGGLTRLGRSADRACARLAQGHRRRSEPSFKLNLPFKFTQAEILRRQVLNYRRGREVGQQNEFLQEMSAYVLNAQNWPLSSVSWSSSESVQVLPCHNASQRPGRAPGRQARVNPNRAAAVVTNGRSPCEWLFGLVVVTVCHVYLRGGL